MTLFFVLFLLTFLLRLVLDSILYHKWMEPHLVSGYIMWNVFIESVQSTFIIIYHVGFFFLSAARNWEPIKSDRHFIECGWMWLHECQNKFIYVPLTLIVNLIFFSVLIFSHCSSLFWFFNEFYEYPFFHLEQSLGIAGEWFVLIFITRQRACSMTIHVHSSFPSYIGTWICRESKKKKAATTWSEYHERVESWINLTWSISRISNEYIEIANNSTQ